MKRQQQVIDLLCLAKKRIGTEERWIKKAMARDDDDLQCHPSAHDAVSWCSVGALHRCKAFEEDALVAAEALDKATWVKSGCGAITYNDRVETTHADVMARFDDAIALVASGSFEPTCI